MKRLLFVLTFMSLTFPCLLYTSQMLIATNYSNKMSLDMRLIDQQYGDSPGNKASHCAAKIAEYYYKYLDQKGTQFVFSDPVSYTHLDVYKRQLMFFEFLIFNIYNFIVFIKNNIFCCE